MPTFIERNITSDLINFIRLEDDEELSILNSRFTMAEYPWSTYTSPLNIPEEADLYIPCSFTSILNAMESGNSVLESEFYKDLPLHISELFKQTTNILELMNNYKTVFIPDNWRGIDLDVIGMEPISPRIKGTLPDKIPGKNYFINPKKMQSVHKELERLAGYFLEPSDSPYASPMVVAPKATDPFIRICGDYKYINQFIEFTKHFIKNVKVELEKIQRFTYFADMDMVNAFHQIRISKFFSDLLTILTPWGAKRPKFLPEGVNIAPGILQMVVSEIFKEFDDWMIVIYDNFLVLATSPEDLYHKLELVFKRCVEVNLQLKLKKTFIGYQVVKFFGYICDGTTHSYRVDPERAIDISLIPRPTCLRELQALLGHGQSFIPHCKNYAMRAAPLTELLKKTVNWKDSSLWTTERIAAFEDFKQMITDSFSLYFPNYDWDFVLVTDASVWGCAGILYQINADTNIMEPLAAVSHKFSIQAMNWTTIDQEAFGNYFPVLKLQHFLIGKPFILMTDHFNLLYIEKSIVPRIKRMHAFLAQFKFLIQHIPGKLNLVADYYSRLHSPTNLDEESINLLYSYINAFLPGKEGEDYVQHIFEACHNAHVGHMGVRKTFARINAKYPGHGIPYVVIAELVAKCMSCQKFHTDLNTKLDLMIPEIKSLLKEDIRASIGLDVEEISIDIHGNRVIFMIVVHRTKLVYAYASKTKDTISAARALFTFFSLYGIYLEIYSDPGSEYTSGLIEQLTKWYGTSHKFSLVDRHESNGVEGTNQQLLRHLLFLVHDKRVVNRWSDPEILCIILHILNSNISDETKFSAYQLHFGSNDTKYFRLPDSSDLSSEPEEYLKKLDSDIRALRQTSYEYMLQVKHERTKVNTKNPINYYQPGDLILFDDFPDGAMKPDKLSIPYKGPFEVTNHKDNIVSCKHINLGTAKEFHVSRVKTFHCNRNDLNEWNMAMEIAKLDRDQYSIKDIVTYYGNPMKRYTTYYLVNFADGESVWKQYDKDLFDSEPFYNFVHLNPRFPQLYPLEFTNTVAQTFISDINKKFISIVFPQIQPGVKFYLDIRYFDNQGGWYCNLNLPELHSKNYVFECIYTYWGGSNTEENHKWIHFRVKLTNETYKFNTYSVKAWGTHLIINKLYDINITRRLLIKYPQLLPDDAVEDNISINDSNNINNI